MLINKIELYRCELYRFAVTCIDTKYLLSSEGTKKDCIALEYSFSILKL